MEDSSSHHFRTVYMALNTRTRSTVQPMAATVVIALVIVACMLSSTYARQERECILDPGCAKDECDQKCRDKNRAMGGYGYKADCHYHSLDMIKCCCSVYFNEKGSELGRW
ncbi:hypothetical protein U9M48_000457 [Paspalum notatum var. saurae]|uniref:Uncharacterized protein n=1 Tax=Paspalum notatum var. saurae TaxID=547442 RepID=A0AAQ3PH05_PASNO